MTGMILVVHVLAALSSVVWSSTALLRPGKAKLNWSYGLAGLTLASGTYLVVHLHAPLVSACTSGLVYLAVVTPLTVLARRRLLN